MSHLAADKQQKRHTGNQGQGAFFTERDTLLIIEEEKMATPLKVYSFCWSSDPHNVQI